MSWREIAWNGVRFSAPAAWEVAKIGPRYLLLTDQGEPALEIKWEKIKGRFSHRTAFRRLSSLHGKTVQESPFPDGWKQVLNGFTATGFAWQAESKGGRGAILYCPACANATLIQFFHHKSNPIAETCLHILSTFQDHATDDRVRWSLFDIKAVIPSQYQLARYRFEAGRYELNFASRKETVALYRWGPASALLAAEDLVAFAAKTLEGQRSDWLALTWSEHPSAEWEKRFPAGLWARFGERLTGTRHYQKMRLWHLPEKNRIMGVTVRGNKPYLPEFFDTLCLSYESL
jgi:hypothetical protein